MTYDIVIIGAGPAGLSAAIYASHAGMSVIVLDKGVYGGQIALTDMLDNYPGIRKIEGTDFAISLYNHATDAGATVNFEEVTSVELESKIKKVITRDNTYETKAVIIANGAARRLLGVPGEQEFTGKGVSYCATCDGSFFKGKDVAIVGGGNTALNDALYLSNICSKVYLIHRRDEFRGEKKAQNAIIARGNIEILYSSHLKKVSGEGKVESITVDTPAGEKQISVSGVFIAVGQTPETAVYKGLVPVSPSGHLLVGEDCLTPIEGVYVAGDIREKPLRQVVTAVADGAVAAVAASEYCNTNF